MDEKKLQISSRMKLLRDSYLRGLPDKLRKIENAWQDMLARQFVQEELQEIVRALHTIAGTTSTFGYTTLGDMARRTEKLLKPFLGTGVLPDDVRNQFIQYLAELREICLQVKLADHADKMPEGPSAAMDSPQRQGKNIVIVDDDKQFASDLKFQLECFGYDVLLFSSLEEWKQAFPELDVACLLLDMGFPEGELAGADALRWLRVKQVQPVPVIFLSERNDVVARLTAVQSGGDAYFLKPLRITDLIDKIDALTRKVDHEPFRVLIIDDDATLAVHHSLLLEQQCMQVKILTQPLNILDCLSQFSPDILLLDLDMPVCNGYELAKMIRQIPAYVRIPIVFLSGETDLGMQIKALGMGGDDFLTKPVRPEHFISSVQIRAERMRMLRLFMERDGLSGLYNHSVMKEHIEQMFLHSLRSGDPLTLAIVDLDNFKRINDTYGHIAGDMVIVVLSRLIEQRVRPGDMVGRVGGEEFAVIMPGIEAREGYRLMEDIRKSFENMGHEAQNGSFKTSFSCGIASSPGYSDASGLYDAADTALYTAKNSGKNRTCIVGAEIQG